MQCAAVWIFHCIHIKIEDAMRCKWYSAVQCIAVQCATCFIPFHTHSLKCQYSMSKQNSEWMPYHALTLCADNSHRHTQNATQKKNELNNAFHAEREIMPQRILYQLCAWVCAFRNVQWWNIIKAFHIINSMENLFGLAIYCCMHYRKHQRAFEIRATCFDQILW